MKNMAVALNAGTPAQRNVLTNYFAKAGWAYWHWIDDFWIVQVPDSFTPQTLHLSLETLDAMGSTTILIFEFHGPIEFWGRADKAAWDWLSHIGSPR